LTIEITITLEYHDFKNQASKFLCKLASWIAIFPKCHQNRLRFGENLEMDETIVSNGSGEYQLGIKIRSTSQVKVSFEKWWACRKVPGNETLFRAASPDFETPKRRKMRHYFPIVTGE